MTLPGNPMDVLKINNSSILIFLSPFLPFFHLGKIQVTMSVTCN